MKNIKKIPLIFSILSILTFFTPANAEIKVVASIKPIHSLASYLMDGIAKPDLIVDGYASPHGFAMKPSHAKMLQNAIMVKKRMIMTTTNMTIMMDMRMVNLIHTFGWTQLMQKLC